MHLPGLALTAKSMITFVPTCSYIPPSQLTNKEASAVLCCSCIMHLLTVQFNYYSTAQNQVKIEHAFLICWVKHAHTFCCVRVRLDFVDLDFVLCFPKATLLSCSIASTYVKNCLISTSYLAGLFEIFILLHI